MKNLYPLNNNASPNVVYNAETLNMIRSIVDELYQMNRDEIQLEKVRFTAFEMINDSHCTKTMIKPRFMKSRSKVDSSVSTDDLSSIQCHCATQTMNMIDFPDRHSSLLSSTTSLLTLSTTSLFSKILPSSSTAHRLLVPGEGKPDDTYQDQTNSDSTVGQEGLIQCDDSRSKRKLCETNLSMKRFAFSNERRRLEELYLSPQSLQLMFNDDLIYIDDLVKVFLVNPSEFHRILAKRYHIPAKQAILTSKIIEQWWENIQQ